jgi:CrcB protein
VPLSKPVNLLLVFLGAALGTGLRLVLSATIPDLGGIPMGIFVVNILGAFALGLLLGLLSTERSDRDRTHYLQLFFGTGLIAGFTTYSALAVDTVLLFEQQSLAVGLLYSVGSVVLGVAAGYGGMMCGRAFTSRAAG